MADELTKEPEPNLITLGGREYKLSPLNLNVLSAIEEEFDCGVAEIGEILNNRQASALRKLIYVLLKDNYPDLTKDKIGEMISIGQLEEVSNAVKEALEE